MAKDKTDRKNFTGRKKVNRYTEGMCDSVLNRLMDHKQDNSKYANDVAARRRDIMRRNNARLQASSKRTV